MTIAISNLRKTYDKKVAVADLSLRVEPGEILGFLGPNGAGKSTTVKVLTGLLTPDSGTASICGFDIVKDPLEAKKRFGFCVLNYRVTSNRTHLLAKREA